MGIDPKQQPKGQDPRMDSKTSGITGTAIVNVKASSSAPPPGHWRGGHFWPSAEIAQAEVTQSQLEQIKNDPRVVIFDPNAPIPTTEEVLQERDNRVAEEVARQKDERERAEAADKLRKDPGGFKPKPKKKTHDAVAERNAITETEGKNFGKDR